MSDSAATEAALQPVPREVFERALDAAVRRHFDLRHRAGVITRPYEQVSEIAKRVVRRQLHDTVHAALAAVWPPA